MVAPCSPGLVRVQVDDDLVVMGMLADRRDELGRARTQTVNRLHRLLLELFPRRGKAVPVRAAGPRNDRHDPAT
jgi:transposase